MDLMVSFFNPKNKIWHKNNLAIILSIIALLVAFTSIFLSMFLVTSQSRSSTIRTQATSDCVVKYCEYPGGGGGPPDFTKPYFQRAGNNYSDPSCAIPIDNLTTFCFSDYFCQQAGGTCVPFYAGLVCDGTIDPNIECPDNYDCCINDPYCREMTCTDVDPAFPSSRTIWKARSAEFYYSDPSCVNEVIPEEYCIDLSIPTSPPTPTSLPSPISPPPPGEPPRSGPIGCSLSCCSDSTTDTYKCSVIVRGGPDACWITWPGEPTDLTKQVPCGETQVRAKYTTSGNYVYYKIQKGEKIAGCQDYMKDSCDSTSPPGGDGRGGLIPTPTPAGGGRGILDIIMRALPFF